MKRASFPTLFFLSTVALQFIFVATNHAFESKYTLTDEGFLGVDARSYFYHQEHHKSFIDPATGKHYPNKAEAWAQGLRLYLDSDYFYHEIVGLGATIYNSYPVIANSKYFGTGLLHESPKPDLIVGSQIYAQSSVSGYSKLGQLYGKWRIGEPKNGTIGRAGYINMGYPLLNDVEILNKENIKNNPSSTYGFYGELYTDWHIDIYIALSTKASTKTSYGYQRYGNTDPTTGDYTDWFVYLYGARYHINLPELDLGVGSLYTEIVAGRAEDYLSQNYYNLRYAVTCNIFHWIIDSHLYTGKSDGDAYTKPYVREFGPSIPQRYQSRLWDVSVILSIPYQTWYGVYQEVNGPRYDYHWDYYGDKSVDETQPVVGNVNQYLTFTRRSERSWKLKNDLDMAFLNLNGLVISNSYSNGRFREIGKIKKSHEWERDLTISYRFPGKLKDLSSRVQYATARSAIKNDNMDDGRLYFEYSKRLY